MVVVVFVCIGVGFFVQYFQQGVGIGQVWVEVYCQCFQFGWQFDFGVDQYQYVWFVVVVLDQVVQCVLVVGIVQVGVEIEQQVDIVLVGLVDYLQCGVGIGWVDRRIFVVQVNVVQVFGDGLVVQGLLYVYQCLLEQFDDVFFILGFDYDQGGIGVDQCVQVLQFVYVGLIFWGCYDSKGDGYWFSMVLFFVIIVGVCLGYVFGSEVGMKMILVVGFKGGVGKIIVVIYLVVYVVLQGKVMVIVDVDLQGFSICWV